MKINTKKIKVVECKEPKLTKYESPAGTIIFNVVHGILLAVVIACMIIAAILSV
jgi:hypothetical protein